MVGKLVVGVIWAWSIACLLAPALPLASAGRAVFWILVVVHGIECAVFLPRLRGAGGSLANHLVQTFLFGFAHLSTLPKTAESRE